MKKVFFTLLFVCAVTVCSAVSPSVGAKIGGNLSKLSVSNSDVKHSFQPGLDLGGFARLNFKKWYVQPELIYSYQITKFKDLSDQIKSESNVKTHNINIPVLLGYKLMDLKMTNVRIFLGPEFNYMLNESHSNTVENEGDGGEDIVEGYRYNYKSGEGASGDEGNLDIDYFSPLKVSGCAGVGVDIAKFSIDLKYGYTFTKVVKGDSKSHNNVISLSLGWKFL